MKNKYTRDYFLKRIVRQDVRAQKIPTEDLLDVLNDGFAEISTIGMYFSDEEVVDMGQYYADGELRLTLDVEEDVTQIYDYYLTSEGESQEEFVNGIKKFQDSRFKRLDSTDVNSMWLDSRYNGRVHIDLKQLPSNEQADNAIIKYFYVPNSESEFYYMDNQTRLATESAMAAAMYDYVHDVERAGQKRAAMKRQAMAIIPDIPDDLEYPFRSVFTGGGI